MEKNYHYKHSFLIGYGEVDEYNRTRISALLNYMQNVATMHSKTLGYGTTECNELNIGWILLSWQLKIYSLPKGDTNVEIQTWSRAIRGCHAFRGFEITDESGNLVAEVDSMWALLDRKSGRPIRPLEGMKEKYKELDRKYFDEEKIKIPEPEKYENKINMTIQRRDIDTNKHCNNTKYIEYALEVIPEDVYSKKIISNVEIIYKKAVVYGENIEITCSNIEENEYVCVIRKEDGEVGAIVRLLFK